MEVSTFELVYKPQAPASPPSTTVERVIQGYFLTISNLENTAYRYRVEFVITPPPATVPNQAFRSLAGNTLVFVDTAGVDNSSGILNGTLASSVFTPSTGLITIPPRGTALLAVLPSVFPVPIDPTPITTPVFEVRGYVRLTLPALLSFPPLAYVPQSTTPVRVLLTPQHRATFLSATGAITAQVQATLPVATGGAASSITPDPGGPIVIGPITTLPPLIEVGETLSLMDDPTRTAMLLTLLAQAAPEATNLRALNDILTEANIPVAVQRAARKS